MSSGFGPPKEFGGFSNLKHSKEKMLNMFTKTNYGKKSNGFRCFSNFCIAKAVLHPKSQFSYSGGKSSCTYCSIEASIWLLRKLIFHDDPSLKGTVEKIIKTGVGYDKQLGHRSCDEAYRYIPRYQHALVVGNLYFGRIRDGCYVKLLKGMEDRAHGRFVDPMEQFKKPEEPEKEGKEIKKEVSVKRPETPKPKRIAVVLTKPPETILVFYDPEDKVFPFVVFDSHPRSFELFRGAGFYFFNTRENCAQHLKTLFPAMKLNMKPGKEYEAKKYDSYEANFVELRVTSDFMTATTYEKKKPAFELSKEEEDDRDIISSMIISQMKKDEEEEKKKKLALEKKKKKEEEEKEKKAKKEEIKEEVKKDETTKIELSEKKILLDTITTLRKELEKTKNELKEATKKLKEQEFINESVHQINDVSKRKIEELKKKNEEQSQLLNKIHSLTATSSDD